MSLIAPGTRRPRDRGAAAERVRIPVAEAPGRAAAAGFTLIELLIVVVIVAILAGVAVPAFVGYMKRSKTSEATAHLNQIFKGAAAYYQQEWNSQGLTATTRTRCSIGMALYMYLPTSTKKTFTTSVSYTDEWQAVGFWPADPVYYTYEMDGSASACGATANDTTVYSFRAYGNLDADATWSTFELPAGTNANADLYHARGFYVKNELE